ncbi:hypothetical protein [Curtobacterium caseinilyticum]|uniref:Uncharacterized protein n=1 Tax=Curtobacterium caseinilyticum TaxID=3055137 RepID=A0ABT7TLK8_9MICO|nr:hypothetical protein [Curtobacterium caseinilyticum]MDM7890471.1 hypothetical protein [Curtobacterium caseinilyticum]
MVQEIAIRVRLREQDRLGLAEYERMVGSVATVAAVVAWLPTPDERLVLRGRTAEPVRLETVSYGDVFEMLVVLDQDSAEVERAAAAVAALVASVRDEEVADDVAGIAGELDRLDRSAPRGRSTVERSLRSFLEGARADVLARRTTTKVRAAQALLRLAEDGAELVVERVEDALAPVVDEQPVEVFAESGSAVVVEPAEGLAPSGVRAPRAEEQSDDEEQSDAGQSDDESGTEESGKKKHDEKKHDEKKHDKKKHDKKKSDAKKSGKKKSGKKKDKKK